MFFLILTVIILVIAPTPKRLAPFLAVTTMVACLTKVHTSTTQHIEEARRRAGQGVAPLPLSKNSRSSFTNEY